MYGQRQSSGVTFLFPNPIMLLILVFGGMESWRRWQRRNDPGSQEYYKVSTRDRVMVAAVYLGLIALLVVGMQHTHITRTLGDA